MGNQKLILSPRPPKGEDGYRTFSIRIKEDTVSQLDEIVTKTGRTRNELVNIFINYAIYNCEIAE